MRKVDLIIIGAGPGGYETAAAEASKGRKVVLVDRDPYAGGTCLNRGCIPTKALCAAASTLGAIAGASLFGITVNGVTADYGTAHRHAEGVVATLRTDIDTLLSGVERIQGEARVAPGPVVIVGDEVLAAPKVIIATGSHPAPLRVQGAEHAIDSDTFLALDSLPSSAIVVGGGVIGMEFASVMNAFGTEVTVLEYCREVLPGFDAELAKRLRSKLARKGIKFVTGANVEAIEPFCDSYKVSYATAKGNTSVTAGMVLGAVGRRPNIPEGCSEAGIELTDRGFIAVDADMRTTAEGFYAVGDVNGISMLAHSAVAQSRRAVGEKVNLDVIPGVVFTMPELAAVGLNADSAAAAGTEAITVKVPYGACGKALADGADDGILKLTVSASDGRVLGCSVVGAHAADLVAEATVAIHAGLTAADLASVIVHAHPSISELLAIAASRALI